MSLENILFYIAVIIVMALAGYALYLLHKVKVHKTEQALLSEQAAQRAESKYQEQRNELIKDLRFLANSVLQEQCEITEGVLRIRYVMQRLEPDLWQSEQVKNIRKHYDLTRDMPILDAYKQLSKKEQRELDKKRWKLEMDAKPHIEEDLRKILTYPFK